MTSRYADPAFPIRSSRSLIASFEMDPRGIIFVIEGKEYDPFVYSKIVSTYLGGRNIKHEIIRIETIDQSDYGVTRGAAGKNAVLNFYKWCQKHSVLSGGFNREKYYIIFALDKDLDDFKSKMETSNHIVYTNHYDIESLLYCNIDVVEVIAAASSADPPSVVSALGRMPDIKHFAIAWKEWAALCYVNDILNINDRGIGFNPSRINMPYHSNTNITEYETLKAEMKRRGRMLGISDVEIDNRLDEALDIVDSSDYYKIFKGKWYTTILSSVAVSALKPLGYDVRLIEHKISSSVKSSVNYTTLIWNEMRTAIDIAAVFVN